LAPNAGVREPSGAYIALADGRCHTHVARLTALAQRAIDIAVDPPPSGPGMPRPSEETLAVRFPFEPGIAGYSDLVEVRVADGAYFGRPCAAWFRLRGPLVSGTEPTPQERLAVAADSANGIGAILDFKRYVFMNNDLTINLLRKPVGEWICVDARIGRKQ
jgi:hypothetical protein